MSASSLLAPLLRPSTELPVAAAKRIFWEPLLFATAAALLFAILAVPRIDFEKAAAAALDQAENAAQLTPHERQEKVDTVRRVGTLGAYVGASLGPALEAMAVAFALWVAFRVAGGRATYAGAFTVSAWGLVPGAVGSLLAIPALIARSPIDPENLARLLPSSPGALLAPGATGALASFLWSVDIFSVWSVLLVGLGMAGVAGVSRRRSVAVVVILWLSQVAVFKVALPLLAAGARPA